MFLSSISRTDPHITTLTAGHITLLSCAARATHTYTIYIVFWILDAKVGRPPHATWYARRVSLLPTLHALTCRLGAPAHPWNVRAFSYPGRCRSGDAPTLYNVFESLMPRWTGRPMPLGMCVE